MQTIREMISDKGYNPKDHVLFLKERLKIDLEIDSDISERIEKLFEIVIFNFDKDNVKVNFDLSMWLSYLRNADVSSKVHDINIGFVQCMSYWNQGLKFFNIFVDGKLFLNLCFEEPINTILINSEKELEGIDLKSSDFSHELKKYKKRVYNVTTYFFNDIKIKVFTLNKQYNFTKVLQPIHFPKIFRVNL